MLLPTCNRIPFFVLMILLSSNVCYSQAILEKGVAVTDENLNALAKTSDEYDVAFSNQIDFGDATVRAFILLEDKRRLFSLSDEKILYLSDFVTRKPLGSWSIAGYPEDVRMFGERLVAAPYIAADYGEEYTENTPMESLEFNEPPSYLFDKAYQDGLGCFQRSPLRFGDIDKNGSNELVLHIGNSLVLFSLSTHKVIFSMGWRSQDEVLRESYPEQEELGEGIDFNAADAPQFIAESGVYPLIIPFLPARRSYAKSFYDDFDKDNAKDILVWRKLYESRLNDDPVRGFNLIGEALIHYELNANRYVLQKTNEKEIRGWLVESGLKWRDGYPGVSECETDNGALIPDMHDSLLNDSDLLK